MGLGENNHSKRTNTDLSMFWMKFFILAVFLLTSCVAKPATRELYEEDLKLERQLKLINKPSVKTVKVRALLYLYTYIFVHI